MAATRVAAVTVVTSVLVAMAVVSVVSAAMRHTQELPASFVATQAHDGASVGLLDLIASDLDGDGIIGHADILGVVSAFGGPSPDGSPGDTNGDGVVDILDLAMVGRNFGATVYDREL